MSWSLPDMESAVLSDFRLRVFAVSVGDPEDADTDGKRDAGGEEEEEEEDAQDDEVSIVTLHTAVVAMMETDDTDDDVDDVVLVKTVPANV